MEWEHKRVVISPQQRAIRKRLKSGLKFATPAVTECRVRAIVDLMERGLWFRGSSVKEYAQLWQISEKRVQQLAAEANRRYHDV